LKAGLITGRRAGALAAVVALFAIGASAAEAAFPGRNGRIAFTREVRVEADSEPEPASKVIQTASATGRHRRTLRTCPDRGCIFKPHAAGNFGRRPAELVAHRPDRVHRPRDHDLYTVRTDGSGLRRIANGHGKRKDDDGRDGELLYLEPSWRPVR